MRKPVWPNANKEVTMATSHRSPPPGICYTEFSVENKCTYLNTRAHLHDIVTRKHVKNVWCLWFECPSVMYRLKKKKLYDLYFSYQLVG